MIMLNKTDLDNLRGGGRGLQLLRQADLRPEYLKFNLLKNTKTFLFLRNAACTSSCPSCGTRTLSSAPTAGSQRGPPGSPLSESAESARSAHNSNFEIR